MTDRAINAGDVAWRKAGPASAGRKENDAEVTIERAAVTHSAEHRRQLTSKAGIRRRLHRQQAQFCADTRAIKQNQNRQADIQQAAENAAGMRS